MQNEIVTHKPDLQSERMTLRNLQLDQPYLDVHKVRSDVTIERTIRNPKL
jgi:hypothetical protein